MDYPSAGRTWTDEASVEYPSVGTTWTEEASVEYPSVGTAVETDASACMTSLEDPLACMSRMVLEQNQTMWHGTIHDKNKYCRS